MISTVAVTSAFTGFRFPPEVIVVAIRWYPPFGLSYRWITRFRRLASRYERIGKPSLSWPAPSSATAEPSAPAYYSTTPTEMRS